MKRLLVTFALAIIAGTAVAASVENILVRNGDFAYGHFKGRVHESREGGRYASFDLDGVRYVITNPDLLDEIDEIIEPQIALGKKQADLGAKQAELGAEQAELGAEQAAIGAKQAWARDERARELAAEQRELSEKQRELGEKQRELGDRQRVLGDKQRELGKKIERELEKVFRNAVQSGVAKRR